MAAYYNEHDPKAAAWLRELVKEGVIAPGEVDERSIEDVIPTELTGFSQCHFFAGIGVWSYVLRQAGWPDDRQVWTGSCPCQPFSAAGKGGGITDERHLWPAFLHLIEQCRPRTIFGEQVSSKDGLTWLDIVSSDLEGAGYSIGAADICAAGVGAPHIRQRLYFVAESVGKQKQPTTARRPYTEPCERSDIIIVADADVGPGLGGVARTGKRAISAGDGEMCAGDELADSDRAGRLRAGSTQPKERNGDSVADGRSRTDELENPEGHGREQGRSKSARIERGFDASDGESGSENASDARQPVQASLTNGFWHDAEWLYCRDGKYRPTKPGIFPLANGITGRVGLLRGAGNAIVSETAKEWIAAYMDIRISQVRV